MYDISATGVRIDLWLASCDVYSRCGMHVGVTVRLRRSDRAGCELIPADTSRDIFDGGTLLFLTMVPSYQLMAMTLRSTGKLRDAR
jgi:hypothetical protein